MPEERTNSRRIVLIVLAALALVEGGMLFYAARQARSSKPLESDNVADQWLGKWIGPEGTYLELSKNGNHYAVIIQSLDGPNTYEGVSAPHGIVFQRNGKTETIRAGNGQDTGMKWLLDKRNCLVIHTGEGFCRD